MPLQRNVRSCSGNLALEGGKEIKMTFKGARAMNTRDIAVL
jgi:hypothetical protein